MLKELKIKLLLLIKKSCINNYIIFDSLDKVKENNNNKYIHVISLVNYIIIDKSIDADTKINDIFVSRSHNKLNFDFEKLLYFNNKAIIFSPKEFKNFKKIYQYFCNRFVFSMDFNLSPFLILDNWEKEGQKN